MDATPTRIHLCGQLRFALGEEDRAAVLRGRQGRMSFAFLVLNRHRPVRRDELVEALWSDDGAPPSEAALAPVLSRLRKAVAPGTVEGRDGVTLALPEPAWVDVEVAAAALTAARAALAEGRHEDAAAAAREAAELVAAGLLPGLGDAPWLTDARSAIDDLRVEALEVAACAGLAAGALPQAEADARAAVALAPFRESARAALIRALAARGNVAEAVRAYEELRTLLRDELGTVPGPELMALHGELVAAEPPPAPTLAPASAAPAASPRPVPSATPDLVERERELERIAAAADALAAGRGGLVLFEGPAGIGKSRLLSELRDRALAAGAGALEARATTLEREYGFGVVRQLFEVVGPDHPALADAPGARAILGHAAAGAAGEGLFAAFHGLHHLVGQLARERPLLLSVDDLQWSDTESLRFCAYLARRLSRLPVLLAATIRTGEPDADEGLLAELAVDPDARVLEPQPLTPTATARLVRARLGDDADTAFTAACHTVTAGNPLLLRQLLNALESEGVTPDADHAAAVEAIGPRAVARTVLLRLARLPTDAIGVARAVAILGENPGLPAIAALADIAEPQAADAIAILDRAEILRGDAPLGFVHPLVRDAVYEELPAARRALEHARAARVLADLGAAPEAVAAQLLRAPERGDAWTVERLCRAAEVALERGAPVPARVYLERALAEPPEVPLRGPLALELGRVASYVHGPAAVSALRRALAEVTDPIDRAHAVHMLAAILVFVEGASEAAVLVREARDTLPEPERDLRDGLTAVRLACANFGASEVDPSELSVLEQVARGPRGQGPGSRELTAMAALITAVITGPSDIAARLGREVLADDVMLRGEPGLFTPCGAIAIALVDPAEAARTWERVAAFSSRRGSLLDALASLLWGGLNLMWLGDLRGAAESQERSHEGEKLFGTAVSGDMGYTPGILAMIAVARGRLDEAERGLWLTGEHRGDSDGTRFWLFGKAELALARGRFDEAIAIADAVAPGRPPTTNPIWAPWRSLKARGLAGIGRHDEARALAAQELEIARAYGSPWGTGRALRGLGELSEGAEAVARLREATALLDGTTAGLERARAWAALARATGEDAARATAIELTRAVGAEGLEAELASGAPGAAGPRGAQA
ncbi:MAG TPA: BTAD domain-containing putative transcriptional regulator [Baekduia sp.]|uniref:ATP-binding protein n=1 Tax=Baekduia sp. TaxID=2600305 RepID=UPI002D780491|nr:BTAD domain-containing putative transcriptional regulator [Baekduia sp.]HET6510434.1 BTAD domain-containing putative transcriptional regulator [Baekduia sp.]